MYWYSKEAKHSGFGLDIHQVANWNGPRMPVYMSHLAQKPGGEPPWKTSSGEDIEDDTRLRKVATAVGYKEDMPTTNGNSHPGEKDKREVEERKEEEAGQYPCPGACRHIFMQKDRLGV